VNLPNDPSPVGPVRAKVSIWRGIGRALRVAFNVTRKTLVTLILMLSIGMFIGGVALAMSKSLFDLASSAVSRITSQTVRSGHAAAIQSAQNDLRVSRTQLAIRDAQIAELRRQTASGRNAQHEIRTLSRKIATRDAQIAALRRQNASLRAAQLVTYRGRTIPAGAAVSLAARNASAGMAGIATRSVASMAGKALPFVGTTVIVAATAWQLKSVCDITTQLSELDAAFNPNNAISNNDVCGMPVPNRAEIWAMIRESPGNVWEGARHNFPDLPDIEFPQIPSWVFEWGRRLMCSTVGGDDCET
jgi:hypothetical protein